MGNKVKNTFKILKKLGEGTYGAVYLVKDLTGNKYAFKLPTTDDAQDELTNEEEILEEINCKEGFSCIAGVTIIPELSNRPGLLSKYIDGSIDLAKLVYGEEMDGENVDHLDLSTFKSIVRQCVDILVEMGELGIIHGDIKLQNMLYNEKTKHVTLIDFGGACSSKGKLSACAQTVTFPSPKIKAYDKNRRSASGVQTPWDMLNTLKRKDLVDNDVYGMLLVVQGLAENLKKPKIWVKFIKGLVKMYDQFSPMELKLFFNDLLANE